MASRWDEVQATAGRSHPPVYLGKAPGTIIGGGRTMTTVGVIEGTSQASGEEKLQGYANPDILVSTEWLAEHLHDKSLRVLECDEDVLLYDQGHIPGAIKIDWLTELNDPLRRDYLDQTHFEALL